MTAPETRAAAAERAEALPETMRVVALRAPGGPEVLEPASRPVPRPRAGEVVIRLRHAGVNRPDVLQRSGLYKPPPGASDLPGLEGAGEVAALGPGVASLRLGEPVCALLPGGGYAEYVATPAAHCLPVPEGLSLREAAALPETAFTVWSNMVMRGRLAPGERLLIHGGSSGIGTTAIQIARALGARVFVTAGSRAKREACERLGAERAIDYRDEDFVSIMRGLGGADVILDMVGGGYIPRNLDALADDGRLVQIAFLSGPKAEVNFAQLMTRRLTITGSTLRPQSNVAKARIAAELRAHVWPMVASGALRPVIDSALPLEAAAEAHARMERSEHIGKIVLDV